MARKKDGQQKGKKEDFNMSCLATSLLFNCRMKFLLSSSASFAHTQSPSNSDI